MNDPSQSRLVTTHTVAVPQRYYLQTWRNMCPHYVGHVLLHKPQGVMQDITT
eukprot:m.1001512 g.1001512  ORF g.1001512 m.1001512 type:complete len:52 (-) comp24030_c0_seq2:14-169(-)